MDCCFLICCSFAKISNSERYWLLVDLTSQMIPFRFYMVSAFRSRSACKAMLYSTICFIYLFAYYFQFSLYSLYLQYSYLKACNCSRRVCVSFFWSYCYKKMTQFLSIVAESSFSRASLCLMSCQLSFQRLMTWRLSSSFLDQRVESSSSFWCMVRMVSSWNSLIFELLSVLCALDFSLKLSLISVSLEISCSCCTMVCQSQYFRLLLSTNFQNSSISFLFASAS